MRWIFVLVLLALSSIGSAQPLHPVGSLTLYDADGKRVGPIFGYQPYRSWFVIRVGDHAVPLSLSIGSDDTLVIGDSANNSFLYESTDCSGPAYLATGARPLPVTAIGGPAPGHPGGGSGNIVYVPDPAYPPQPIVVRSIASPRNDECSALSLEPASALRVKALIDLDAQFRLPFVARAEPAHDVARLERRVAALEAELARLRLEH